jgi:DNA topoisomerase-1
VDSGDINGYLKEITGQDFTAKDFRTWSGTVLAATALREVPPPGTKRETERNVNVAIEAVAGLLGNTPTVCRKSYVHPGVVDAYRDRTMAVVSGRKKAPARIAGLRADEVTCMALLKYSRAETPPGGARVRPSPRGPPLPTSFTSIGIKANPLLAFIGITN